MRILQVTGGLNRGGAETWLVEVFKHIDRSKYQFDFLVHGTEPGAYDEEVKALGAQIIPCITPSNPLQYAINFRRILREYGPYDCIHSHVHHYSGYVLMMAAIMQGSVRIAHSHLDTRAIDHNSSFFRRAYVSGMETLIRHFSNLGIAVSKAAAQSLFSEFWTSDPRWHLCCLGIDLMPFGQEVDSQQVRAQLGIPLDRYVIGHVGRFCEQKNHRFLVDIAERFCRLEPRTVFLLVGDGPLRAEIEGIVHTRGLAKHFIFTGVRSDVPRLMKGAMDCFLFPSIYEGMGLVLWEAQAASLRCLISDTVPNEADVVVTHVRRLPIRSPAEVWARELQEIVLKVDMPHNSLNSELNRCAIGASVAKMESIYHSLNETRQ